MQNPVGRGMVVVAVALAGCAHAQRTIPLDGSSLAPAAMGTVSLKDKDEVNKSLHVAVQHLARPENLPREALGSDDAPTAQAYVVWLQPSVGGPPQNIGALIPDANLDADLTATTPQTKFDVFVTPEPSATQTAPTGRRILQATVGR